MSIYKGDPAGGYRLYLWSNQGKTISANSLPEILRAMKKAGVKPVIDRESITFLLHNSLIPMPRTIYKNVSVLGIGDVMEGGEYRCDFPYYNSLSTGLSVPSTKTLLDLLCTSVKTRLKDDGALMMSSGKDSVSIALAIKEAGLSDKVYAYTYGDPESGYTDEAEEAAKISARLGMNHKMISVPSDEKAVKAALLNFFENTSMPSCDPTTIPYACGLHQEGIKDTQILDGTRNDIYFGIVPSVSYGALGRFYQILGGGWGGFKSLRQGILFYHKANKFFSTFPEVNLYKHGHFRSRETSAFFGETLDTEKFWLDVYKDQADHPLDDIRTFVIGKYFDGCSVTQKGQMVAESINCESVLSWADKALAEYCFNLPQDHKFDRKSRTNKVLLRSMLAEYLDYDAQSIGKRIFYFNMSRFVLKNKTFVKDEILSCRLWKPEIQNALNHYLDICESQPRAGGAILDLFMVSGWCNHSKYLKA